MRLLLSILLILPTLLYPQAVRPPGQSQTGLPLGGDLTGTTDSATVIRIRGRLVTSAAPQDGQVFCWNQTTNLIEWCFAGAATVSSVFGRIGHVVATNGDYNFNQIAGTVTNSQLASGIDATKIGAGGVTNSVFAYLENVTSDIQAQINGKAAAVHEHNFADLTTGTCTIAQGCVGITGYTAGDMIYADDDNSLALIPGNTDAVKKFLCAEGDGMAPGTPAWCQIEGADLEEHTHTESDITDLLHQHPAVAIGSLPAASGATNHVYVVTDAQSKTDCAVGGGAVRVTCVSDGSAWTPSAGDGGGGGGGGDISGNLNGVGSIPFVSALDTLSEDNANLFFDDSANRVGIGVNSSLGAKLDISGNSSGDILFRVYDRTASTGVTRAQIRAGAGQSTTNLFEVLNNADTLIARISSAGFLSQGINVTTGHAMTVGNPGDTDESSITVYPGDTLAEPPYLRMLDSNANNSYLFPCGNLAGRWCQDSAQPGVAYTNPLLSRDSSDDVSNKKINPWLDFHGVSAPSNPAAGVCRMFFNSSAGEVQWVNSAGATCGPSGGGGGGGSAYATIQEEGSGLTQRTILNFVGGGFTATDDTTRTNVTLDADLNALAALGSVGFAARTTTDTWAQRVMTGTTNEITITNGNGVDGNPVLSIATAFDISGKTSTAPVKAGTDLPGTCSPPQLFFDTDATAGLNLYACTASDTWTLLGDGNDGSGEADMVTAAGTLTTDEPLIGADGKAAAVGSRTGDTTQFVTSDSTTTQDRVTAFDADGNLTATSTTVPHPANKEFVPVTCLNGTGYGAWGSIAAESEPAATCGPSGTNTTAWATADFDADADEMIQSHIRLPLAWTGTLAARIVWTADSASTNSVVWGLATKCAAVTENPDAIAWNTAQTETDAHNGTAYVLQEHVIASVTVTGCTAGENFFFRLRRDADNGSDNLAADAKLFQVLFEMASN